MAKRNFIIRLLNFLLKFASSICAFSLLLAYITPFVHPETFWPLPFFGLAYPVFLGLTFFFLIIWALLRSKWFFILLTILLLGGKLHFRMYSTSIGNEIVPEKTETLKIVSYNVRLFDIFNYYETKDPTLRNGIYDYLDKQNADVYCIQEFFHQDKNKFFPTKDTLIKLLEAPYFHDRYSHNSRARKNYGIVMFSKYPMISKGDVIFDDPENKSNNYCIFADIVKNKDTFRIYNVHLQSIKLQQDDYKVFGDKEENNMNGKKPSNVKLMIKKLKEAYPIRANQAKKVVEHIETSPYEVIVCGDFNDTPLSYVYNVFYSKYIDAFKNSSSGIGATYAGKVPAGRIDYIFHSQKLHSGNFSVQKNVYSDHRAISCEIWK
jgi:endonuclease/exonuclease/phosphatase family metal-dependent hydrolase